MEPVPETYVDHVDDMINMITSKYESMKKEKLLRNTRPLPRTASTYKLETFKSNILKMFVHYRKSGMKMQRIGKDVDALKQTFQKFNFEVFIHTQYDKDEVAKELKRLGETDFSEYGCIAVAVLNHCDSDKALPSCDVEMIMKHLSAHKNPTLYTKPRILIVQSCRDAKSNQGIIASPDTKTTRYPDMKDSLYYPHEPDVLIIQSSVKGTPSFRDTNGSWFIQSLCSQINKLADSMHMLEILMEVTREVAIDREIITFNGDTKIQQTLKQMPVVTSTLIRKLYLSSNRSDPSKGSVIFK